MRLIAFVFLVLAFVTQGAAAQSPSYSEPVVTGNAKSWLVSEKRAISPGETLTVAFYQELREGWHVYWKNPGDSGLPLVLNWTLPEGYSAGDIQYPVPHKLPFGPLLNYGHEGKLAFLVEVTAPETAVAGSDVTFDVAASWLICADVCIPENGDLTLTLPVVDEPQRTDFAAAKIFADARAHLPAPQAATATWYDIDGAPALAVTGGFIAGAEDIYFFEAVGGLVEPAAPQKVHVEGDTAYLSFTAGYEYAPAGLQTLPGVIAWESDGYQGMEIIAARGEDVPAAFSATAAADAVDVAEDVPAAPPAETTGLLTILGMSLLGGIILNVMPCVFPVIFIKAASLAKSAQEERGTIIRHGFLYTFGILITFLAMAGLLMALRAGGEQIGWGFHLQSPITVSIFAVVILLVGLNLAGVFEIGTSVQGVGSGLASRGGNAGAFFTGLLAVAVAAPCIGPFLGVPVGYALSAPAAVGFMVFGLIGLGLALPYLLISLMPGLANMLPKPGPWMETFKQVLSFAMFATLIWLIWTLTLQAGTQGLVLLLIALLVAGFAAWAFGKGQTARGSWGMISKAVALAALVGAGWIIAGITPQARVVAATSAPGEGDLTKLPTAIYSEAALEEYRAQGVPVFIDFTAAWCVTCQFNKTTVLTRPPVVAAFHEKNVIYMVADWTVQDPEITKALEKQGRSGVPLYLFYAPGVEKPQVLPQTLSIDLMLKTFSEL